MLILFNKALSRCGKAQVRAKQCAHYFSSRNHHTTGCEHATTSSGDHRAHCPGSFRLFLGDEVPEINSGLVGIAGLCARIAPSLSVLPSYCPPAR